MMEEANAGQTKWAVANTGGFGQNCGLYTILHPLVEKLCASPHDNDFLLPEFFNKPPYKKLLETFADFYQVEKESLQWRHIRKLLLKYSHPLDREMIFGPVLRCFIKPALINQEDAKDAFKLSCGVEVQEGNLDCYYLQIKKAYLDYKKQDSKKDNSTKFDEALFHQFWEKSGYVTFLDSLNQPKALTMEVLEWMGKYLSISISLVVEGRIRNFKPDFSSNLAYFTVYICNRNKNHWEFLWPEQEAIQHNKYYTDNGKKSAQLQRETDLQPSVRKFIQNIQKKSIQTPSTEVQQCENKSALATTIRSDLPSIIQEKTAKDINLDGTESEALRDAVRTVIDAVISFQPTFFELVHNRSCNELLSERDFSVITHYVLVLNQLEDYLKTSEQCKTELNSWCESIKEINREVIALQGVYPSMKDKKPVLSFINQQSSIIERHGGKLSEGKKDQLKGFLDDQLVLFSKIISFNPDAVGSFALSIFSQNEVKRLKELIQRPVSENNKLKEQLIQKIQTIDLENDVWTKLNFDRNEVKSLQTFLESLQTEEASNLSVKLLKAQETEIYGAYKRHTELDQGMQFNRYLGTATPEEWLRSLGFAGGCKDENKYYQNVLEQLNDLILAYYRSHHAEERWLSRLTQALNQQQRIIIKFATGTDNLPSEFLHVLEQKNASLEKEQELLLKEKQELLLEKKRKLLQAISGYAKGRPGYAKGRQNFVRKKQETNFGNSIISGWGRYSPTGKPQLAMHNQAQFKQFVTAWNEFKFSRNRFELNNKSGNKPFNKIIQFFKRLFTSLFSKIIARKPSHKESGEIAGSKDSTDVFSTILKKIPSPEIEATSPNSVESEAPTNSHTDILESFDKAAGSNGDTIVSSRTEHEVKKPSNSKTTLKKKHCQPIVKNGESRFKKLEKTETACENKGKGRFFLLYLRNSSFRGKNTGHFFRTRLKNGKVVFIKTPHPLSKRRRLKGKSHP